MASRKGRREDLSRDEVFASAKMGFQVQRNGYAKLFITDPLHLEPRTEGIDRQVRSLVESVIEKHQAAPAQSEQ